MGAMAKAVKAMKAMKAMAAMKAMRAMKKKAVSKIAKGKFAKSVVFRGTKAKTVGCLTKSDLVENKRGKIVSKKSLAHGKKAYANIKAWTAAVQKARKALNVKGFVAVKKGSPSTRRPRSFSTERFSVAAAPAVGLSTSVECRSLSDCISLLNTCDEGCQSSKQ